MAVATAGNRRVSFSKGKHERVKKFRLSARPLMAIFRELRLPLKLQDAVGHGGSATATC
jgi:hypothetical protein